MKVILYDAVAKLGTAGEIKEVADGFARNFLFPRKLAYPATNAYLKRWESESKNRQIKLGKDIESAQSVAKQIETFSPLTLSVKAGKEGHLFGSVTSQMIADSLSEKGVSIDKKSIVIESPIKLLGEYQVTIRLHAQVSVALKLNVVSQSPVQDQTPSPSVPAEATKAS